VHVPDTGASVLRFVSTCPGSVRGGAHHNPDGRGSCSRPFSTHPSMGAIAFARYLLELAHRAVSATPWTNMAPRGVWVVVVFDARVMPAHSAPRWHAKCCSVGRDAPLRARGLGDRVPIRIVLADRYRVCCAATRSVLDCHDGLRVTADGDDPSQCAAQTGVEDADVVVVGLNRLAEDAYELVVSVRRIYARTSIVVFALADDCWDAQEAIRLGATAYVTRDRPVEELHEAVLKAHAGAICLRGEFVSRLDPADAFARSRTASLMELPTPTPRQRKIIEPAALGHTDDEAASILAVSVRTVGSHRSRMREWLDLRSRGGIPLRGAGGHREHQGIDAERPQRTCVWKERGR